ncbi:lactate racemase domain-containing protein [Alteribacillus sp. HJP-4]|uniref:lactate racemase domain-containing protein n=1 Tax=Alteribacillus sp. HJP-4 TaxID=2775394 RepID=UPI0035CD0925
MKLYEIEQTLADDKLIDIRQGVEKELSECKALHSLERGSEVAITAGSRGITNIDQITKHVVEYVKNLGLIPFLVPAMGSHGGATAQGQREVLKHLHITEEAVGAEIRSSMEVELTGHTEEGVPVYIDKHACSAGGIIVVNRVKAHTAFRGSVESGLSKMVTIGLGKIKGATYVHSHGAGQMAQNITGVCRTALETTPILCGLAIIENGYEETADIQLVEPQHWFEREAELLVKAKEMMPSLPVHNIDVLIVEEMGKIFSGTGMDPNIIGRWRIDGVEEPEAPSVNRITVLDLAERSFGNAQGIGLADFTTQALIDKVDRNATYTNALTSTYLRRAMFPFIYDTEKQSIETAFQSLGPDAEAENARCIQIPNTLHLEKMLVSAPVLDEMERQEVTYRVHEESSLSFDGSGRLVKRLTT